jgi:hypothetical protein
MSLDMSLLKQIIDRLSRPIETKASATSDGGSLMEITLRQR